MIAARLIQLSKKLLYFCLPLLILYSLFCLAMFMLQRQMIFIPATAKSDRFPMIKIDEESDYFAASVHKTASPRAVIYFGGNAEDVTSSLSSLVECFEGCSVYAMHYRGYGGSPGRPNEMRLHRDAKTLYDRVASSHSEVIVVGRSLGSGVAVRLAAEKKVDRLLLVTPFDSLASVAQSQFPYLPVKLLMLDPFNSSALAPKISSPTLILAAAQDEIIPASSTRRLFDAFSEGICTYEIIDPADHNSIELPRELIQRFIKGETSGVRPNHSSPL